MSQKYSTWLQIVRNSSNSSKWVKINPFLKMGTDWSKRPLSSERKEEETKECERLPIVTRLI